MNDAATIDGITYKIEELPNGKTRLSVVDDASGLPVVGPIYDDASAAERIYADAVRAADAALDDAETIRTEDPA